MSCHPETISFSSSRGLVFWPSSTSSEIRVSAWAASLIKSLRISPYVGTDGPPSILCQYLLSKRRPNVYVQLAKPSSTFEMASRSSSSNSKQASTTVILSGVREPPLFPSNLRSLSSDRGKSRSGSNLCTLSVGLICSSALSSTVLPASLGRLELSSLIRRRTILCRVCCDISARVLSVISLGRHPIHTRMTSQFNVENDARKGHCFPLQ